MTIASNVKVLVGTFNQEKALVGAFSMIVKTNCENRLIVFGTRHYLGPDEAEDTKHAEVWYYKAMYPDIILH